LFARTPEEKSDVDNYVRWINFDNGNIRASELWDEVIILEGMKDYQNMASKCTTLLTMLTTRKAKLLVFHKIAVVEFEFLGLKEKGIERMREAYTWLEREKASLPAEDYQKFLDTYGAMLYRLGMEAREKQEKKTALAYFSKAASFDWDRVAKVYIELVTLLWNDHEKAILYGKKALAKGNGLSESETSELLSLLVRAHKSAGLFEEARVYFDKWKTMRSK
jgi:hypothetical protein